MLIPDDIKQRIENGLIQAPETAVVDFASVEGAVCRRCGEATMRRQKTPQGWAILPTEHYAEMRVEFDDGSANIMGVCDNCADNVEPDELEWMYCLDLKSWNETGPVNWDVVGRREPVSAERV